MHFKFSPLAALALAGCAFLAPAAHAAQPYTDGDVLLAIRAAANPAASYLYNLGSATGFLDSTTQLTLELSIQSDLTTIFGANWSTRSDLFWSVTGVQKFASDETGIAANSMFISTKHAGELVPGVKSSNAFQPFSTSGSNSPALKLQLMGSRYGEGSGAIGTAAVESSANDFGLRQPNGEPNAYASYTPGGANTVGSSFFGVFTANGGVENNFAAGPSLAALDFYAITPNAGTPLFEGSFSVDSNAVVTFTPEGVPEPASAAVLAAGAMVLGFVRRRRVAAAH